MWLEFVIILMKYCLLLNLQLQGQDVNLRFPNAKDVFTMLSPFEYTQSKYKRQWIRGTIFQQHFWDPSYFLMCFKIKVWILIFWLTQTICSGDVSVSWHWCQVLFMPFCPPGTCKSISHPQAVSGKEKHWSLILSWSTPFSAPWLISWPGRNKSVIPMRTWDTPSVFTLSGSSFLLTLLKPCYTGVAQSWKFSTKELCAC